MIKDRRLNTTFCNLSYLFITRTGIATGGEVTTGIATEVSADVWSRLERIMDATYININERVRHGHEKA